MPLDNAKLARAVNTTEKLVRRMDAYEERRRDDYGHPVKSEGNHVQQTDYGRGDAEGKTREQYLSRYNTPEKEAGKRKQEEIDKKRAARAGGHLKED